MQFNSNLTSQTRMITLEVPSKFSDSRCRLMLHQQALTKKELNSKYMTTSQLRVFVRPSA